MDLHRLRSIVVLAEQLHFGRAARVLGMSQPALSKQLAQVEADVGARLFVRGRGGVEPTAVGRQVVERGRALLGAAADLLHEAQRAARGETGLLRLGFGVTTATLVARLVVELRRQNPGLAVELSDMSTPDQIAALDAGTLDLGFIRLPAPARFQVAAVFSDELVLVAPRGSPLARARRGTAFADADFIFLPRALSATFDDHVLRVCGELGFRPRVVQLARDYPTVLALVEANFGVSILPASIFERLKANVISVRLPTPAARWQIGAVWRKGERGPLLDRFRALLARSGRS